MRQVIVLIGLILLVICVEILGGLLIGISAKNWYLTLEKPIWIPPAWIFIPVWILLYLMMALAFFLVWKKKEHRLYKTAAWLWGMQLLLNLLWIGLFFALQSPLLGMIDLIALSIVLFFTISVFLKISRLAGILMIPYILWVMYAAAINITVWTYSGFS